MIFSKKYSILDFGPELHKGSATPVNGEKLSTKYHELQVYLQLSRQASDRDFFLFVKRKAACNNESRELLE